MKKRRRHLPTCSQLTDIVPPNVRNKNTARYPVGLHSSVNGARFSINECTALAVLPMIDTGVDSNQHIQRAGR